MSKHHPIMLLVRSLPTELQVPEQRPHVCQGKVLQGLQEGIEEVHCSESTLAQISFLANRRRFDIEIFLPSGRRCKWEVPRSEDHHQNEMSSLFLSGSPLLANGSLSSTTRGPESKYPFLGAWESLGLYY